MRIVAGEFGSRRLVAPKGAETRPTSDRARGSLFQMLGGVAGARCLDLFAGSGALGLEALSRGAADCTFVERDPAALTALRRNIEALGVQARTRVRKADAIAFLRAQRRSGGRFDLVFVDPPYASLQHFSEALDELLAALVDPEGRVVLESPAGAGATLASFDPLRTRRIGAAELAILSPLRGTAH